MNSMKRALFGNKSNSKGDRIRIKGTNAKDKNDDASAKGSIKGDNLRVYFFSFSFFSHHLKIC